METSFSVVLNTFERSSRNSDLKRSFKSIIKQSLKPKELIIVNSGDKKLYLDLITKYKKKKNFTIKIVNCSKKTNISQAKNIGAKNCKFSFLAFLDDDDAWGINYLKKSKKFILKNNAEIILSYVYSELKEKTILFKKPESQKLSDFFNYNTGAMGSNLIISKKKFNLVKGFDAKLITGEDKGIIMDLIIKKEIIFFQKNFVYYNMITPNSITKQPLKVIEGVSAFYKKYKNHMPVKNKVFVLMRIHSFKKKINKIYFFSFLILFILNKILNL
tara:strand:+ start:310 stop:1128 length:819 start_codon:yes stop_codon:yes gene_type:complete